MMPTGPQKSELLHSASDTPALWLESVLLQPVNQQLPLWAMECLISGGLSPSSNFAALMLWILDSAQVVGIRNGSDVSMHPKILWGLFNCPCPVGVSASPWFPLRALTTTPLTSPSRTARRELKCHLCLKLREGYCPCDGRKTQVFFTHRQILYHWSPSGSLLSLNECELYAIDIYPTAWLRVLRWHSGLCQSSSKSVQTGAGLLEIISMFHTLWPWH